MKVFMSKMRQLESELGEALEKDEITPADFVKEYSRINRRKTAQSQYMSEIMEKTLKSSETN